jgi:vesicle coat complex subunit
MAETIFLLGGVVFFGVSMLLVKRIIRTHRQAKNNSEKTQWVLERLQCALEQIESEDEDVTIAGLQILAEMKDPGIRFKAFPRLTELTQSSNPQVKKYAKIALHKFVSSSDKKFRDSVDK